MKYLRLSLLVCVFAAVLALLPARAHADVSFDFFYDNLSPYGQWIDVDGYGMCWQPGNVDPDWTPYSDGYWAYTDAGWTWVSYEDFGGIVYHYGRWIRIEDAGWCWMPDYDWAPAWVSWRYSDDYVGWAPLPPEARWRRDVGIAIWADSMYDIGPGYYSFCRVRDFGAPVLRPVILNRSENAAILRRTVNVTNITYHAGSGGGAVIFNGGPNFAKINAVSARPIPALKLVQNVNIDPAAGRQRNGPRGASPFAAQTVGNQLIVAAPHVSPPADPAAFRSQAKKVIAAARVSKGWGIVKNNGQQQELRQEIQRQSKGYTPESAPARPVAAAELTAVPSVADPRATPNTGSNGGSHEKKGKDRRPEAIVSQPATVPLSIPVLKPFSPDAGQNRGAQNNPPATKFTPPSKGSGAAEAGAREQDRIRAEQERLAQQKQVAAAQDAARVQAEESRRHESEARQQQEQPQFKQQPQPQTQQPQQQSAHDAGKEREHEREKSEAQRGNQIPPPPQRSSQFSQPQPHGNQTPGSPQPGGSKHSKDSKDKDKDKDKDKNGN